LLIRPGDAVRQRRRPEVRRRAAHREGAAFDHRRHAQLNKVNFAILDWFGPRYERRFTDLDKQLGEIYCAGDPTQYAHCLVKPVGQIDLPAIVNEKENIDRIVATLGLKEMTQGTLVRKLCTYDADPTRQAVFECDKLVRSIYTLRYLRDPQLQRFVHRSQNRIESYHQLRSAISPLFGAPQQRLIQDIAKGVIAKNANIPERMITGENIDRPSNQATYFAGKRP